MPVYLIRAGENGPVKIGHAENPWARLSNAQTDCPIPLSLIAVLDGKAEEEAALHAQFSHLRIRGEWFRWSDDFFRICQDNPPERAARRRRGKPRTKLEHWIEKNGLTAEKFAEAVEVSSAQISRILAGKSYPSVPLILRIFQYTKREITPNDLLVWSAISNTDGTP